MTATATNELWDESLTTALGEAALFPEAFPDLAYKWDGLARLDGKQPRKWQRELLHDLGEQIRSRNFDPSGKHGHTTVDAVRLAVASGHGIGKSAVAAWIMHWAFFCWPLSRGLVTANTQTQVKTRTWAACGEWLRLSILESRAVYLASRGNMRMYDPRNPESHDLVAYTASPGQEESLQGLHSPEIALFLADEASGIPKEVYEAVKGAAVGGMGVQILLGNPTRSSGQFWDCWHKERGLWVTRKVDSRTVEDAQGPLLQQWVDLYGEDSDFVRVRVRGEFPRTSAVQFYEGDIIEFCFDELTYEPTLRDPLIYQCDVAHTGPDNSVLIKRHGRKVLPDIVASPEWRVEEFGDIIIKEALKERPDAIFIEETGVGAALPGIVRRSVNCPVFGINPAGKSPDPHYGNMRAYCGGKLRDAMRAGLDLPRQSETRHSDSLRDDLMALEYGHRISDNALMFERKDDARNRGIASPDFHDALAIGFAWPVPFREEPAPPLGELPDGIHSPRAGPDPRQGFQDYSLGLRRQGGGVHNTVNPRWRA